MQSSTIEAARQRYAIAQWGDGVFDLNDDGELCVCVDGDPARWLPLSVLTQRALSAGLRLPLLLRVPSILQRRAEALQTAFMDAIDQTEWATGYTPVYPIKVNQQASVVQTLTSIEGMGLEVGSKPELIAALALCPPGRLLICNGYKDSHYVELALTGIQLGLRVVLVIEKPTEWPLILRVSKRLGVTPTIGVRMRLAALGKGNWQNTGGERAKFGLTAHQLLDLIEQLRIQDALDWFELLHVHMGSQISNLRDIQGGVREAARYYVELVEQGVPLTHLDIGGGLGVDYEGGRSRTYCSMNYGLAQYAQAIVEGLSDVCASHQVPMPQLVSESGRALTAHHAVIITNVTATERFPIAQAERVDAQASSTLQHLQAVSVECQTREPEESYLEAEHWLHEGRNRFLYGELSLAERAQLEPLYHGVLHQLLDRLDMDQRRHRELHERIQTELSDKYFINLSIFQSLPDIWAIDQVFPIVPLSRHLEVPDRRAVLEDLTCDSDGRVDHYVERGQLERTLAVHTVDSGEPYWLGIFMTGAYQETLGDIHNLFGDTDSANLEFTNDGFELTNQRQGDRAERLLQMVGYEPAALLEHAMQTMERAPISADQRRAIERMLRRGLASYTYLEADEG
ncbi:MAG: biosynthetic arginine decarboxylase [Pseudomonadota bacterium]